MAIKKVVIAAAGQGTRMLGLTKDRPKHLIEVNSRPFLAYVLDNLILSGYTEVVLVVGYKSKLMLDFKNKYIAPNKVKIKIDLVDQYEILGTGEEISGQNKKIYGTACPLMCVKNDIKEEFLYICGDNLFSVEDLKEMNVSDNFNYVAGLEHKNPENYGVLVSKGEYLEKIVEKPLAGQVKEFEGNVINAGLYKFTPEIFEKISQIKKSVRDEYEITDAISLLAEEKKVKIKKIKNFWMDFGRPEDVERFSKFLNETNSAR